MNRRTSIKFINSIFLWIFLANFSILHSIAYAEDSAQVVYDAKGRRDPFVPLGRRPGSAPLTGLEGVESIDDLTIEGVVVDPKKGSYVIVNGEILAAGQTKHGVKASEIRSDGVQFEIQGKSDFKRYSQNAEEKPQSD